ncbi:MAG: acyl-CoA dehydratase activase [Desulfobacterales bacterium]
MMAAGVDVGAESVKLVMLKDEEILFLKAVTTEEEGEIASRCLLDEGLKKTGLTRNAFSCIVSTGTGRATVSFADQHRSQQLCHARGTHWRIPSVRTVLDIGAEGSRAMRVNEKGKVTDFAVNSKCASGTGVFLKSMTKIVDLPLEEMGQMAAAANTAVKISSFCAVFAESEVISRIHTGSSKESIVAGIHESVVSRLMEVLNRVKIEKDLAVTGGVAKNIGIIGRLEARTNLKIRIPEEPQATGALGAALIARDIGGKQ